MPSQKKLWMIVTLVAILAAVFVAWKYTRNDNKFDPSVDVGTLSGEQQEEYWKDLAELYKKDTYGGKTPEETLQLFIDALKRGDTDLAAKYFVPEKQKKETEDLKLAMKSGGIDRLLEYYDHNNFEETSLEDLDIYELTVHNANKEEPGFLFRFIFNKSNNIWKITDL